MNVVRTCTCPRSLSILCALYHGGMLGADARSSFGVPSRSIQYIYSSRNNQLVLCSVVLGIM